MFYFCHIIEISILFRFIGPQSTKTVQTASNQQWCVHQVEQGHSEHAPYRGTLHHMGIPEFEECARGEMHSICIIQIYFSIY